MTKTFYLKDIIQEYENMTLENAINVIMDTPLSKLLNLTENDKDIVFSELECNYTTARNKFTFRDFIDVYPSFLKDTGMTMRGEIRSAADQYIELADTIEYMCNMAEDRQNKACHGRQSTAPNKHQGLHRQCQDDMRTERPLLNGAERLFCTGRQALQHHP